MSSIRKDLKVYFAIGFLSLVLGLGFFWGIGSHQWDKASQVQAQEAVKQVNVGTIDLEDAVVNVAQAVTPAVVNITVEKAVPVSAAPNPFGDDPMFRYFFGEPRRGTPQTPRKELQMGLGTGMIIDDKGDILTNNHVVDGADKITVKLSSGETMEAKLVGADPKTDLAVIRVKPTKGMKYVSFGDSDKLKVGQWVVAIGNPRGLDQTVTVGVISAKNRTGIGLLGPSGYEDYVQTDAAVNPGNSGGPLVNLRGEVIGINSAIFSTSGGFQGISFAIPSNMAKAIAESLMKSGKVVRGWLGVGIQDLTPELAKNFGLKETKGVLVPQVFEGSPAEKAGIEQGDVITKYDGMSMANANEIRNMVAATPVGKEVEIVLLRKGQEKKVRVRIGEQTEEKLALARSGEADPLGLRVQDISREIARQMGLTSTDGALIVEVEEGSRAAEAGLEAGDIVLQVGDSKVKNAADYSRVVAQLEEDEGAILLVRNVQNGQTIFVMVR